MSITLIINLLYLYFHIYMIKSVLFSYNIVQLLLLKELEL